MLRWILPLVLLVGCDDAGLSRSCPQTCFDGPESKARLGVCRPGVPRCNEDGEILECVGQVLPSAEVCDGVDNDCDGEVDGIFIQASSPSNDCLKHGPCAGTRKVCDPQVGWRCDYPPGYPRAEECNGISDDCDREVDEDHEVYPELEFCYTGPASTAAVGACHPGVKACKAGVEVCQGETVPRQEQCNDLDDDCNGLTDDVSEQYDGIDMVFGIDFSGSMSATIQLVKDAVCGYAEGRGSTRFALVGIGIPDGQSTLLANLGTPESVCEALASTPTSGSTEPTITAAADVVYDQNPMGLAWAENNRRIFVGFGDEPAQAIGCGTFDAACMSEAVSKSVQDCTESDTQVNWVVSVPAHYEDQAAGCGGQHFWLFPDPGHLANVLNQIVSEVCVSVPGN